MEPDEAVESALVTKQQLDLERPRPGRPSPPWPSSGKVARVLVEKDIEPLQEPTLAEPSRPMVKDHDMLQALSCQPSHQATPGGTRQPPAAVPLASRPMVQDYAKLRRAAQNLR